MKEKATQNLFDRDRIAGYNDHPVYRLIYTVRRANCPRWIHNSEYCQACDPLGGYILGICTGCSITG